MSQSQNGVVGNSEQVQYPHTTINIYFHQALGNCIIDYEMCHAIVTFGYLYIL